MNGRIADIKQAVEQTERCRATHVASTVVREKHEGKTVWEGVVETLDLHDHPKAKRAYAWLRGQSTGERRDPEYTIALGIPPVNSPETAVRAAIAAIYRNL
jgi:hypothetical protein